MTPTRSFKEVVFEVDSRFSTCNAVIKIKEAFVATTCSQKLECSQVGMFLAFSAVKAQVRVKSDQSTSTYSV